MRRKAFEGRGICGCLGLREGRWCARLPGFRMKKRYLRLVRLSFRSLRHPRLRHRSWWQALTRPVSNRALWIPCRDTVAMGVAIGSFFSMMLMPFQGIAAAVLAIRFRANVPFAVAACFLSNPVTTPAILWGQFVLGDWLRKTVGVPMPHFLCQVELNAPVGQLNAASFLLGMITSGLLTALAAYPVVHVLAAVMPHHLPVRRRKSRALLKAPQPPPG